MARGNLPACSVEWCDRPVAHLTFCSAHYQRQRRGRSMGSPIEMKDSSRGCRVDGCKGKHCGEGLCAKHFRQVTQARKKTFLVTSSGSVCADCGGSFHHSAMDFHHIDSSVKETNVSILIRTADMAAAVAEARKCILLCANCHRVRHASTEIDSFINERKPYG